eukprot:UN11526
MFNLQWALTICLAISIYSARGGDSDCVISLWTDPSYLGHQLGPFGQGAYTGLTNKNYYSNSGVTGHNTVSSYKMVAAPFTHCRFEIYDSFNFGSGLTNMECDNSQGTAFRTCSKASMSQDNKLSPFKLYAIEDGVIADIPPIAIVDLPRHHPFYNGNNNKPVDHDVYTFTAN